MGFDVMGHKPRTGEGEYFRNNVWWWKPLWGYVAQNCRDILTEEEIKGGCFNDGVFISSEKARGIGLRLRFLIDQKEVKKFEEAYQKALDRLSDVPCEICNGTGERDDGVVKEKCNCCEGKGKRRPWACHYPFSEENVSEFAKFAIESGGFTIW